MDNEHVLLEVMRGVMLARLAAELTTCESEALALFGFVLKRDLRSVNEITLNEARYIRGLAYPHYVEGKWCIDDEFRSIAAMVVAQHRERVAGQMRLW